jgi:hypothetical protein
VTRERGFDATDGDSPAKVQAKTFGGSRVKNADACPGIEQKV